MGALDAVKRMPDVLPQLSAESAQQLYPPTHGAADTHAHPVVAAFRTADAALGKRTYVSMDGPDLVLYDAMCLLGGDSTELASMVHETSTAVLFVSRDLRPGLAAQALAAGADGLVSVGACPDEIFESISTALTGRRLRDGAALGLGLVGVDEE